MISDNGVDNLHFSWRLSPANDTTNITTITLNHFNRTAPTFQTSYSLSLPGNWSFISTPDQEFECTVIYDTS
jgi:hypothetical protein